MLAKIKIKSRWEYGRKNDKGKMSQVLAFERMDRKELKEYERKVCKRLREAKVTVEERASVSEAWWTNYIKEERRYKKMLQRNVAEEIRMRRTEHKYWNKKVKK